MTTSTLVETITQADPVRTWRLEQLRRAGYTLVDALVLSGRPDVDLHLATRLLGQGCPPDTALRILI